MVTGTALVTTYFKRHARPLMRRKENTMARQKKEGTIDRNTLIVRNVTLTTYEVTYLPVNSETVHRARETLTVNEQTAKRIIRMNYNDKGFIVSIVPVEAQSKPYAMTIEDFVKNGFILDTNKEEK